MKKINFFTLLTSIQFSQSDTTLNEEVAADWFSRLNWHLSSLRFPWDGSRLLLCLGGGGGPTLKKSKSLKV